MMDNARTECNARELHDIEFLAALDARLISGQINLKARLQTIPNGWRDFRMIAARTGRLVEQIYRTVPAKTLRHMEHLVANGEIVIRLRPAARTAEFQLVDSNDLVTLINTAMAAECAMCLRDRAEIKACELRKSLLGIAPPVDLDLGPCPYRAVCESSDLGQYISRR